MLDKGQLEDEIKTELFHWLDLSLGYVSELRISEMMSTCYVDNFLSQMLEVNLEHFASEKYWISKIMSYFIQVDQASSPL